VEDSLADEWEHQRRQRNTHCNLFVAGQKDTTTVKMGQDQQRRREIKNDYDKTWFEIAELKVKDPLTEFSSFLL